MARALRIEYAGACYHVINRGVERRRIFSDQRDFEKYLRLCYQLKSRYSVSVYAYCLMPNHYHMFIRTRDPNLRSFMQELNGRYSQYYNRRRGRVGPLFQGRYKGILVQAEEYGQKVARYIHLNPVKAGLADRPEEYRWSSYGAYVGRDRGWLVDTGCLFGFYSGTRKMKREALRRETLKWEGEEYDPDGRLKGGIIAGTAKFWEWLKRKAIPRRKKAGVAYWRQLQAPKRDVGESLMRRISRLTDDRGLRRKLLAYALRHGTGMSLREIAEVVGARSVYAVSKMVRRLEKAREKDEGLDRVMDRLDFHIRGGQ